MIVEPGSRWPKDLAALAAFAAVLLFAGRLVGSEALALVAKPWPVLAMALWVLRARRDRVGMLVIAGLLASAVGDVLLELPGTFIPGIAAFAAAHLLYVSALLVEPAGRRLMLARQLPFVLWVGGLLAWAVPRVGVLGVPFVAYGLIIGVMMGRSAARVSAPPRRDELTLLAGAVLFGLSDSLIAIERAGAHVPGSGFVIVSLYWAGQALIAAGFVRAPRL